MKKILSLVVAFGAVFYLSSCTDDDEPELIIPGEENVISGDITSNTTWTTGNTYILAGRIFINEGVTLTIEPGVVVKGEAGTGDVSEAVKHLRTINSEIAALQALDPNELFVAAKDLQAPYDLVKQVAKEGRLPVGLFTAGGIATPADAAMMMQMGADGVFVGSGIFHSDNPGARAEAIVTAVQHYNDPQAVTDASRGIGDAMVGLNGSDIPAPHRLAARGW